MEHLVNVGSKCYLVIDHIKAIFPVDSGMVKLLKKAAERSNMIVDLTFGKKTKSIVLMDSGHVVLTYMSRERILKKMKGGSSNEG